MVHIKVKDYAAMSRMAGSILYAQILAKPNCTLGLATGSTPIGTYEYLIERVGQDGADFSQVTTFNLDEYCDLPADNPQSYAYFMRQHLLSQLPPAQAHIPDGMAPNIDQECRRYEALLRDIGGVDIQLLGLGHNGHIGFNEPADCFHQVTHQTPLTQSTIQANARFYDSEEEVPKFAVTMGIGTIMRAKRILLVASGKDKTDILYHALEGPVTPQVPASALQLHPDVTVISCV